MFDQAMKSGKTLTFVAIAALVGGGRAAAQGTPAKAMVESQLLVTAEPGLQYSISPKSQHLAAVVLRGSRQVMVHDGVDGPRFDEILPVPPAGDNARVVWSRDGSRFAYFGRVGQEYVIMVDGKEVLRGPWSPELATRGQTPVDQLGFAPGDKHWYLIVHTEASGRANFQLVIDGKPGLVFQAGITPAWSSEGEHHAYVATRFPLNAPQHSLVLIVDGKPAPYQAAEPQFTGDGLHLFTKRQVPGSGATEVLADGAPILRGNSVQLHMAPAGPGVLGVVTVPSQNSLYTSFLTLGNRKVPGSDCVSSVGITGVYLSPDAKHWAFTCQASPTVYWVMADGKKGQEYASVSNVAFTADGRAVYQGSANQRSFLIVGDQESDGHNSITGEWLATRAARSTSNYHPAPAVIGGNRVGYVAMPQSGSNNRVVVVDGKSYPALNGTHLAFSPDGSRFAFLGGHPYLAATVDGVAYPNVTVDHSLGNIGYQGTFQWSPDSKHIAWIGFTQSSPGVIIDGKFAATPGSPRFLRFSADGRHLLWLVRGPPGHLIFLDGEKVLDLPQNLALENEADIYWSFGEDGSVTFVAQDEGAMKRFKITPGAGTSVETLLAKAVQPR